MSAGAIQPWVEVVSLHPDVLSEHFSEDIFALDLGPLADKNPNVPAVYRDPEQFFRASYLTTGLRGLLDDVLSRLAGGDGNRVLKLVTPFGGGKSHTLAALLHSAQNRAALDVIPEGRSLPRPDSVRTAVFDGQFFDATNGKALRGEKFKARTLWGWIAWSLGGKEAYESVRSQDEARIALGGDEILNLLGDQPNLILLDEVLQYLISAGGIQNRANNPSRRDTHISSKADRCSCKYQAIGPCLHPPVEQARVAGVYEPSQTVDHLAARKDQRREPVEGAEVLAVIQRRLLAKVPTPDDATPAAAAYQEILTQMRRAYAGSSAERQQAEDEGIALRDRVRAAYPFHPALVDIMRERWAAIPDFQRTRGALRFLAACLRASHRAGKSRALLGPGDVLINDPEVRLAFFKEVGQQADFQAVLEHDLVGANARARRIDARRAKENPAEALRLPAMRLATAILMYSFGGLRREGGSEGDSLPSGVTEAELLSACVGPDLDSTTALACLKELREQCLYLHFDGARYCFKKDPNVTLLLEQEAEAVARDDRRVRERIKEMIEARLGGQRTAIIWPEKTADIQDREPSFLIAYLPLEFAGKPRATQDQDARSLLESYGDKPRQFRNGIGLAVPSTDQIEILRRSVRYLLAAEQVKTKARQLNLTDDQKSQLREREATDAASAESALLKLYLEVWMPRIENGGVGIEKVAVGGRPLQVTLDDKKRALIHQRVIELITNLQPKVFGSVNPNKIVELFKLGDGTPPCLGIRTSEVVSGFYSFLGFPRLTTSQAIRRAIVEGVQKSVFGYTIGNPAVGSDGKFQVDRSKVAFERPLAEDEVDLESGFLIVPSAVPPLVVPVPTGGPTAAGRESPPQQPEPPVIPSAGEPPQDKDRAIQLRGGSESALYGVERYRQPCRSRGQSEGLNHRKFR